MNRAIHFRFQAAQITEAHYFQPFSRPLECALIAAAFSFWQLRWTIKLLSVNTTEP
jgi:hypothetical protein